VGIPAAAWLRLGCSGANTVFETAANLTRPLYASSSDNGSGRPAVSIQGGVSGFSAYGGAAIISIGGLATPTNLTWGTLGFSQSALVLNAVTANTNLTFANSMDLNGTNRTINVNASTATITGVISNSTGTAGLTKGGAGKLVLTSGCTYTGNTTISAGTLALSGSGSILSTPLITVAGGATFDVSGLSSTFALGSRTLSNSASATGTLIGNLNTGSGNIAVSYTTGTPSFAVTGGTLTLSAGTVLSINNTGAALTAGSYRIISTSAAGFVAGTAPSAVTVTGGGLAASTTASLSISNSELFLVVLSSVAPTPTILPPYVNGSGNLVLRCDTVIGHNYLLLSATNLNPPVVWSTNSTTGGTGGTITNSVPVGPVPTMQFFRYLVQ
jgi:autotransporter-associated beta strand protein